MSALLIVEDEKHLADGLRYNLEAEGYSVDAVSDAESAMARSLFHKVKFRLRKAFYIAFMVVTNKKGV